MFKNMARKISYPFAVMDIETTPTGNRKREYPSSFYPPRFPYVERILLVGILVYYSRQKCKYKSFELVKCRNTREYTDMYRAIYKEINDLKGPLVTFNGYRFDLPVLFLRRRFFLVGKNMDCWGRDEEDIREIEEKIVEKGFDIFYFLARKKYQYEGLSLNSLAKENLKKYKIGNYTDAWEYFQKYKSLKIMIDYNKADCYLTSELYLYLLKNGYLTNEGIKYYLTSTERKEVLNMKPQVSYKRWRESPEFFSDWKKVGRLDIDPNETDPFYWSQVIKFVSYQKRLFFKKVALDGTMKPIKVVNFISFFSKKIYDPKFFANCIDVECPCGSMYRIHLFQFDKKNIEKVYCYKCKKYLGKYQIDYIEKIKKVKKKSSEFVFYKYERFNIL